MGLEKFILGWDKYHGFKDNIKNKLKKTLKVKSERDIKAITDENKKLNHALHDLLKFCNGRMDNKKFKPAYRDVIYVIKQHIGTLKPGRTKVWNSAKEKFENYEPVAPDVDEDDLEHIIML
jgi:hypothetical protein